MNKNFSLILYIISAFTSFAMCNASSPENSPLIITAEKQFQFYFGIAPMGPDTPIISISSSEQLSKYTTSLINIGSQKSEMITKRLSNAYMIPTHMPIGNIEYFWFTCIHLNFQLRERLCDIYSEQQRDHYEKITSHVECFEKIFNQRQWNPITQEKLNYDFLILYTEASDKNFKLFELYNEDMSVDREILYNTCKKAIEYGEKFLLLYDQLNQSNPQRLKPCACLVNTIKLNIMKGAFASFQYVYAVKKDMNLSMFYKKRIEKIHLEIKDDPDYSGKSKFFIEGINLFIESNCKNKSRIKQIKSKNKYKELMQIAEYSNQEVLSSNKTLLWHKHQLVMRQINCDLLRKNIANPMMQSNNLFSESQALITDLESDIAQRIHAAQEIHNPITTQSIYREFHLIFGPANKNSYELYLIVSLISGDIDNALDRALALELVSAEHNENLMKDQRFLVAFIKGLHGDYADLTTLMEEANAIKKAIDKERQLQKQKTRSGVVQAIQKTNEKNDILNAERLREGERADNMAKEKRRQKEEKCEQSTQASRPIVYYDDAPSMHASKADRIERHKAAQQRKETDEQRQREAASRLESLSMEDLKPSASNSSNIDAKPAAPQENTTATFTLQALYDLRGMAQDVNDQIESGRWNFTRENLISYYEAMGCTKRSGKGSHEIVELSGALTFVKNGETISMLIDLGGALTLPRWTDVVPFYLRKQIQMARQKLAQFAEKQQQS